MRAGHSLSSSMTDPTLFDIGYSYYLHWSEESQSNLLIWHFSDCSSSEESLAFGFPSLMACSSQSQTSRLGEYDTDLNRTWTKDWHSVVDTDWQWYLQDLYLLHHFSSAYCLLNFTIIDHDCALAKWFYCLVGHLHCVCDRHWIVVLLQS